MVKLFISRSLIDFQCIRQQQNSDDNTTI